jgi:putative FmdB family regulatory protein
MPIFEYECRSCGHLFEQLILHSTIAECPSCKGRDLEKQISLFAVDSETTRGQALAAGKRKSAALTRERNDAEIAYHKKHDDH